MYVFTALIFFFYLDSIFHISLLYKNTRPTYIFPAKMLILICAVSFSWDISQPVYTSKASPVFAVYHIPFLKHPTDTTAFITFSVKKYASISLFAAGF